MTARSAALRRSSTAAGHHTVPLLDAGEIAAAVGDHVARNTPAPALIMGSSPVDTPRSGVSTGTTP